MHQNFPHMRFLSKITGLPQNWHKFKKSSSGSQPWSRDFFWTLGPQVWTWASPNKACIEGHFVKMKFRPIKRENSAKKRNTGGVQINLEAALPKRPTRLCMIMMMVVITAVIMMIATVKLNLCIITCILHKAEEHCRQCK